MRTFTDLPFCGFVTLTTAPIGKVFDAAVSAPGLKTSPLVVLCPARPGPYHDALTRLLAGVGVAMGCTGRMTIGIDGGGGAAGRVAHA